MITEIGYGRTYKMSGYDMICTGFTKSGKAKMQTLGMTSGRWPGEGNISQYDEKTKAFSLEWEDAISKFRLPSLKRFKKNEDVKAALKTSAENYSSFGAAGGGSWLGTVYGSGGAWYVHSNGYVYGNSYQNGSYVVAPAFNLDPSKVIVEGNEIKRVASDGATLIPAEIEIATSAGILRAYKSTDPGQPGICVALQPAGYEEEIDVSFVSVYEDTGYQTEDKERPVDVVIMSYGDATSEDYSVKEIIRREDVIAGLGTAQLKS